MDNTCHITNNSKCKIGTLDKIQMSKSKFSGRNFKFCLCQSKSNNLKIIIPQNEDYVEINVNLEQKKLNILDKNFIKPLYKSKVKKTNTLVNANKYDDSNTSNNKQHHNTLFKGKKRKLHAHKLTNFMERKQYIENINKIMPIFEVSFLFVLIHSYIFNP